MELLVKPVTLTSYIYIYIYIYMNKGVAKLIPISFYLLQNISTLNQGRMLSSVTIVCKHFASYQGYPSYRWDLIRYAKG
jgi:hypothetical protein